MEDEPENYSLKIKYDANNKEKILRLLAEYKIEAEELKLKYAKNWLFVKQEIAAENFSELEKRLLEVDERIVVEKVKRYSLKKNATGR